MVSPAIVFKSLCERTSCFWRAQRSPIPHLDIKGHMKDKDPNLSLFNSVVYYYCLHLNLEGLWHSTEKTSVFPSTGKGSECYVRPGSYLHHGDHAIIWNRVGADGKMPRWVSADDPVDGIPIRGVRLISIYNRQVSHNDIYTVLGDLSRKL